ncbi:MAG: hypothetical protein QOF60_3452 [Actinomycetota bacterium]|jgi:Fic family protein|nr:hypothetical protein [Actinomycetota bacterium]
MPWPVGAAVAVPWEGRSVDAWRPPAIGAAVPALTSATVRASERAAGAITRMGDLAHSFEVVARLLLRAEGIASSAIEGVRAPAGDIALAEAAGVEAAGETAGWVAGNLAVVGDALAMPGPLDAELLWAWHRRLMRGAGLDPAFLGAWRDRVGWVGGANPLLAAHVAAPDGDLPALMDDLFAFVARDDLDPVTQAAIAHAQFETIHPFADGNGRLGRVLVARVLAHRLDIEVPPPVSIQMARDIGGYLSGLALYRQGHVDAWVRWFAGAVEAAANRSGEVLGAVADLQARWESSLASVRADAAARRLVHHLPARPAISVAAAAAAAGVSEQAARVAIGQLVERGILRPAAPKSSTGPGRPRGWWVADELLALFS